MQILLRGLIFLSSLAFCLPATADPGQLRDQPSSLVYPPFGHTPLGIHYGTPALLAQFVGSRAQLDQPEGLACNRLLTALEARKPGPAFQLTVAGANSGQGNIIYNPALTRLDVVGDASNLPGFFQRPMGVALGPDGALTVADPGACRVRRLRPRAGRLVPDRDLEPPPGGWGQPWGVALDSTGRLYVTDRRLNQILIYSPEGRWLRRLGPQIGSGSLDAPESIAVIDEGEPWSYFHGNYIYCSDRAGERLLRFGFDGGSLLSTSGADLNLSGLAPRFRWMALDYFGQLWVTDSGRNQVHKFDRQLKPLVAVGGEPGHRGLNFNQPSGIAIFRHFGQVFIAEKTGVHYFWIGPDLLPGPMVRRQPGQGQTGLRFLLTEPAYVTLEAQTLPQGPTLSVTQRLLLFSGPQTIHWQETDATWGAGLQCQVTLEATYSSARHWVKKITLPADPVTAFPAP